MPSIVKTVINWGSNTRVSSPVQNDLCEMCGKKPKFVEKGFKHPYCSRSCARNGQDSSPTACILLGCRATGKPAFGNFCSDTHAKDGVRQGQADGCENCNTQPRTVGELCISCDRISQLGPRFKEIGVDGSTFKTVRAQFLSEWESYGPSPQVEKIYEVILPRNVRARHEAYRAQYTFGEEIRTFHSSQCICDLGFKNATLCSFKSCGICCVIKSSFCAFAFEVPCNSGRFGDGIYSYRNSGLADQFATSCTSSPYRVTIACDTIIKAGQSSAGIDGRNERESVFVPIADAIIPAYVIMYIK